MNNVVNLLIKIADELDAEQKYAAAAKVDQTIKNISGRPKAPLKKLDEKVKNDLLKFVDNVVGGLDKSNKNLQELFRRLRYFNIDGIIKDLGLDKMSTEIDRLYERSDEAHKRLHEYAFGRKLNKKEDKADDFDPLSFFGEQHKEDPAEIAENEDVAEKQELEEFMSDDMDEDAELMSFWDTANEEKAESFEEDDEVKE